MYRTLSSLMAEQECSSEPSQLTNYGFRQDQITMALHIVSMLSGKIQNLRITR
jgi:hypothetical protein